jgi:hypothetical protein
VSTLLRGAPGAEPVSMFRGAKKLPNIRGRKRDPRETWDLNSEGKSYINDLKSIHMHITLTSHPYCMKRWCGRRYLKIVSAILAMYWALECHNVTSNPNGQGTFQAKVLKTLPQDDIFITYLYMNM